MKQSREPIGGNGQARRSIEILGLPATGKSFLVANCELLRDDTSATFTALGSTKAAFRVVVVLAALLVLVFLQLSGSTAPLGQRISRIRKIGRGLLEMAVSPLAVREEGPILWSTVAPWRRDTPLHWSVDVLRITYYLLGCGICILQIGSETRYQRLKQREIVDRDTNYHVGKATPRQQERQMDACVSRLVRPSRLAPTIGLIDMDEFTDVSCICQKIYSLRC